MTLLRKLMIISVLFIFESFVLAQDKLCREEVGSRLYFDFAQHRQLELETK